ncbi:MAG: enoyl-CoA hydratase/carnithine racemase [Nitriliruptoraceae bacterium]|jgi:enoyl-CoA hydratase/carnithine racemase
MHSVVTYEVLDRVAIVTIDRPSKRNAMSMDVFDGLRAAGERAGKDCQEEGGVGAVLVRGAGGVFSAGIDLATFGEQFANGPTHEFIDRLQRAFTVFEDLDVPTIAAIEGYCFGAGIQLAAACHVRLVAPSAQLSVMETRWGLVPDLGACYRLPRLVGLGRATELALTARRVGAEEALAMGLCDVGLTSDDPQSEALAFATRLAHGPGAVRRIPRLMRENLARDRAAGLHAERVTQLEAMAGPDFPEAVTAGLQQRAPRYVGR